MHFNFKVTCRLIDSTTSKLESPFLGYSIANFISMVSGNYNSRLTMDSNNYYPRQTYREVFSRIDQRLKLRFPQHGTVEDLKIRREQYNRENPHYTFEDIINVISRERAGSTSTAPANGNAELTSSPPNQMHGYIVDEAYSIPHREEYDSFQPDTDSEGNIRGWGMNPASVLRQKKRFKNMRGTYYSTLFFGPPDSVVNVPDEGLDAAGLKLKNQILADRAEKHAREKAEGEGKVYVGHKQELTEEDRFYAEHGIEPMVG